jgi:hypothetical protein
VKKERRAIAQFNVTFDTYAEADWWFERLINACPDLEVEQQGRTVSWDMDLGAQARPVPVPVPVPVPGADTWDVLIDIEYAEWLRPSIKDLVRRVWDAAHAPVLSVSMYRNFNYDREGESL